jgi:hypothetical protein
MDHSRIISDGLSLKVANTEQAVCDPPQCKPITETSEMVTETDGSSSDWDDSSREEEESEYTDSDCNGIGEEDMNHSRIVSDGLSLKMKNTEQAVCYSSKLIAKISTMDTESEVFGCNWDERVISDCQSLELSNEEQAVCDPPRCKLFSKTSEMVTETDDSGSEWDDSSSEEQESEYTDSDCNGIGEEEMNHSRIISDGPSLKMANIEQAGDDSSEYKPIAKISTMDTESEVFGCDWDERVISDCQSLELSNEEQVVFDPPQCKLFAKTSKMATETDDSGSDWDDSSREEQESEYTDSDCNGISEEETDHSRIISDGLTLKVANTEQAVCDPPQCKLFSKTSEMVTETDDSGSEWDDSSSEEQESEYTDSDCDGIGEEEMNHSRIISDGPSLKMANIEQAGDDSSEYKLSTKASEMVGTAEASKGSGSGSREEETVNFSIITKHAASTAAPSPQLMQHQYLEALMKKQQRSLDQPSLFRRLCRMVYTNPARDTNEEFTVSMEIPEGNSGKAFGPRDDFVRRRGEKPKLSQEDYLLDVVSVQKRPWNRFF